jgi:hypothetical protein
MLIAVVGPAGAGKTHLLWQIRASLRNRLHEELKANPGLLPDLYSEVKNPEMGVYRWRDFYIRALEAAHEPLIDRKLKGSGPNATEDGLRRAYESVLINRKPRAHHVDEAHHWLKIANPSSMVRQMSCVKSLANMSRTIHVLYGTYDLLALGEPDEQLDRRIKFVPLLRYKEADGPYKKILANLISKFGDQAEIDIERELIYIYNHTLGLPGLLVDWLSRGYSRAVFTGKKLTIEILRKTVMKEDRLVNSLREARKCEEFWDKKDDGNELALALANVQEGGKSDQPPTKPKKRAKPGARDAHRDPVAPCSPILQ